ncbi:CAP domain-containing protein [Nonomuraea rhizosphaerae]|uniref:CAP domain-containing protein n=1 Tax=Nonomuraea rhizosphaerae TaxID=2665663 RepID=UPI001C5EF0C0|nr:CAP domain-containing protein [Nonomuraea rhizosphaerae]
MRRPLGVLACIVSLAALGTPVATAHAATVPQTACRLTVAKPQVTAARKITTSASRRGCEGTALVRVRIKRAVPGADPVVKSAAGRGVNPRVRVALPCTPGVYYAVVTDYRGNIGKSRPVRLTTCAPTTTTPTPTPTDTSTPTTSPTATPTPTPSTPSSGGVGTSEENEVVRLTNAERAKGGCQPLKHDAQLRKASFDHSADMAAKNYFSHTSQDGRSFLDRIRGAGFTGGNAWAENIAMGQPTPASVVTAWMNSSGHRANIMNCKYNLIGVGAAKNSRGQIYWTQDFAAR